LYGVGLIFREDNECFCVSTVFERLVFGLKMGVGVYLWHKFSTDYLAETWKKMTKKRKKNDKKFKKVIKKGGKEEKLKKK